MAFEMLFLPYAYDALEPSIDAKLWNCTTQAPPDLPDQPECCSGKHPELGSLSIEQILSDLNRIPEDIRTVVRNNGGGYYNHNIYWAVMGPNRGGEPTGSLGEAIAPPWQFCQLQRADRKSRSWAALAAVGPG